MNSKEIKRQIKREEKQIKYFHKELKRHRITKKVHDQCVRGLTTLLKQLRKKLSEVLVFESRIKSHRKRKLVV
jgi:hypothetical protein